jgi:hypothetical protein
LIGFVSFCVFSFGRVLFEGDNEIEHDFAVFLCRLRLFVDTEVASAHELEFVIWLAFCMEVPDACVRFDN